MSPKRMENLLRTEGIVLNQICNNINEINQKVLDMIDTTMPASEFYQAFRMDDEGNYRMNSEYQGFFKDVVQILDNKMKLLQQEKRNKIEEIAGYTCALRQYQQQSVQQANSTLNYEAQGRVYTNVPSNNVENAYTTLNRQTQDQPFPHFGSMGQYPSGMQSSNSYAYQEENTQGKIL